MTLIDLLPRNYKESREVIELQGALANQVEAIRAAKENLFQQLDINTATWGLKLWEEIYGIKIDITKPDSYRRTRILSKMRGQGTTTKAMIQNVAESFSNGEVEVIEHNGEHRFEIKFTGTIGIPPNMDDLTAAVQDIKPAHLAYEYTYIYRTHRDLSQYTHKYLSNFTYKQIREGLINGD